LQEALLIINRGITLEELLKNDEFIQYIINKYFSSNDMPYHKKIQNVFSSREDFTKAMESFELSEKKGFGG
jgi:hypothetical protein